VLIDRAVEGVILLNTSAVQALPVPVVAISGHQRVKGMTNIGVDNKNPLLRHSNTWFNWGTSGLRFLRDIGAVRIGNTGGKAFCRRRRTSEWKCDQN